MTPDQKSNRLIEISLELGRANRRLTTITQLAEQHPVSVPTEDLRRVLAAPVHTEEKS